MSRFTVTTLWLTKPLMIGGIFFFAAGRFDLPMVWGVLGVLFVFGVVLALVADRGMMCERVKPGPGNKDRLTRRIGAVLIFAHWILAGLDVGRFHWSTVPEAIQIGGLIGFAVGLAGILWAMHSNPFYSSVVRIQSDRGQYPIDIGPYRFVRHPGYTATMFAMLCGALALGSWVGIAPLVVMSALFIRRTVLEDRLLQRELAGYSDYARRVRHRLVAGVF
jgi:protein-S-isoprenylcysteine O-methyltransferase Ste14